jgi:hypothetical protein
MWSCRNHLCSLRFSCLAHARSVAGAIAIFFLGNHNDSTRIDEPIHVFSSITSIPCVVASAGEAEYAALAFRRRTARRFN